MKVQKTFTRKKGSTLSRRLHLTSYRKNLTNAPANAARAYNPNKPKSINVGAMAAA
jgi:hypothetical protein